MRLQECITEIRRLLERGGYAKIQIADVVRQAGGVSKLKSHRYAEDAYDAMLDAMEELVRQLHARGYDEVGELHTTTVGDWVDNLGLPSKYSADELVKDHNFAREAEKIRQDAEGGKDQHGAKQKMTALVQKRLRELDAPHIEAWPMAYDLLGIRY